MVLDSMSPDEFTALPGFAAEQSMMHRGLGVLPSFARLGIARVLPASTWSGLSAPEVSQVQAFAASPRGMRSMRDEQSMYRTVFDQAKALSSLGGKPLVVVTATESLQKTQGWSGLQERLAALSTNSRHRVADATHAGLIDDKVMFEPSVLAIYDVRTRGSHRRTRQLASAHDRGRHDVERNGPRVEPGGGAVTTMSAIAQEKYGLVPEDVFRVADVATPALGDDKVLVRVSASSVDRGTWHVMAGLPYPMRLAGFGLRRPKALNPGRCVAGIVEAVGADVSGFAAGDDVFGVSEGGSFAEQVAVRASKLSRKPANLTYEQAAAVPISGLTALQAVRDVAKLAPGQAVLIIGASGGVGTFAVQIAKAYGTEVTGVCSASKVDLVRSIGADRVIDYTVEDIADGERRYDVILDIGGNRRLSELRRALTRTGQLVIVGGETDGRWLGGTDRQIRAILLSKVVKQKLGTFISSENAADLGVLRELIEAGKVTPVIDRTYPMRETADAIRYLTDGRARGKVVITIPTPHISRLP